MLKKLYLVNLLMDIKILNDFFLDVHWLNDLNMPATLLILSLMDIAASVIDLGAVIILETVSDILYDLSYNNYIDSNIFDLFDF